MKKAVDEVVVFCKFRVEGVHNWADAPEEYKLLRAPHRHMFCGGVSVKVGHDNRHVEFINLKGVVEKRFAQLSNDNADIKWGSKRIMDFGSQSCEMMAKALGDSLIEDGYDIVAVEVNEDDENGAIVYYER